MGSFHRSLSGVLSDMSLYLIRSRSWAPEVTNEIANSKKLLETHTLPEISEGLLVVFDIFVTLYDGRV